MLLPYTHIDDLGKHLMQCDYDPNQFVDYQPRNEKMYLYTTSNMKSASRRKCKNKEGMEDLKNESTKTQKNKKWGYIG